MHALRGERSGAARAIGAQLLGELGSVDQLGGHGKTRRLKIQHYKSFAALARRTDRKDAAGVKKFPLNLGQFVAALRKMLFFSVNS
ncbi:hypothetical protein V8J88_13660 [Massilia sp. W12]|uniref:hypothetical protein n=1 Tax=Massilia sp. W12 TaxID=3126507 RepID=UPI0030CF1BF2